MSEITTEQITIALKTVIDPELGVNIVDLGLIYAVQMQQDQSTPPWITITMTLTSPGCPLASVFERMVRDGLAQIDGLNPERDVKIILTFDPPWTPDMMSEEAKAELGM